MDYRPVDDDERFAEFVTYAFSPQSGPFDPEEYDPDERPDQVGDRRGLFDDDELVAVCNHYWFDVLVRGAKVSMPGLSAVASPPAHRRGGNVEHLLAGSLEEYRDRGDPISVLWPFAAPFYAQYGWATVNRYARYDVDPEDLAFATAAIDDAPESVTYEELDADDWAILDRIDRETWTQTLALVRSEAFWRHRVFQSWDTEPYVYAASRDGDPVAYLVYRIRDVDDGRRLGVAYFGAVDHDALLAVLSFCHVHDSQVDTVRFKAPVDWGIEWLLEDPDAVETTVSAGAMARAVDATTALEAVPVAGDDDSIVIDVADPLVDWHDDPIRVAVSDGSVSAAGAADASPDVEVGVGALTQLLLGTRSASDLARTGELAAVDGTATRDGAIAVLDGWYPPANPCLLQSF